MTTRGRREEYSTNVVRVLHPTRPLSPGTNVTDIDNNLDYLLDDLQSSVSRPDNSLAHSNLTNYSTTSRDVQYLAPVNSTTIVKERSVSPGSDRRKVYQTSSYQYATSTRPSVDVQQVQHVQRVQQQNVNQLDTLLQDLQHEREITRDKDYGNISNVGIDPGLLEPGAHITKTTRIYTTNTLDGKPSVQRELIFESPDSTLSDNLQLRQKSPTYQKTIERKTVRDVQYDAGLPDPDQVISTNTTKRYNYTSSPEQPVAPYTAKTVTLDTTDLPDDLKGVPLSDDILPVPGTKVTTTVRTYTYEIPSDPIITTNKTLLYKNESYNTNTTNSPRPDRDVPQTVVFKTQTYDRNVGPDGYPVEREPREPVPPIQTSTRTVVHKRDTRETTNTAYPPPSSDYPQHPQPTSGRPHATSPPPANTTIIYKHDVTNTTNTNVQPPRDNYGYPPSHPPHHPGQPIQTIHTVHTIHPGQPGYPAQPGQPGYPGHPGQPEQPGYPDQPGPTKTIIYKHETTNTTNTHYGPPGSRQPQPNDKYPSPIITYPDNMYPDKSQLPHPRHPPDPTIVEYKYSSHTSTSNTHGSPNERDPLLPAPFPTDGLEPSDPGAGPPKRLDDLMASFGNTPNGRDLTDEPYMPRKEVETSVATPGKPVATVEPKIPSKNIAGPPVYYPPGHEMFTRKEESSAAYRAQGGYARASGKYEYEAESRSKTKTKSGAAVVPVCLPLCCAMPCTIM